MTKRLLSENEEIIYRLISPDFEGLNLSAAATRMGICIRRAQQLLASAKLHAPQLFEKSPRIPRGRIKSYDPGMDSEIKEKF